MLADRKDRLSASALLAHPICQFYQYLLDEDAHDLHSIANEKAAVVAFVSGMRVANKSKAIISFLSLMNVYLQDQSVIKVIKQQEAYIQIIELLHLCLKDQDPDFMHLYKAGLDSLVNVLATQSDSQTKTKFCLGGISSLLMIAIEKGLFPMNSLLNLIACFDYGHTGTLIHISEKAGFIQRLFS